MIDNSPRHIVIVGGSAAGLELATRLGDSLGRQKRARITLVDRSRSHIWKPLLHSVAAGSLAIYGAGSLAPFSLSQRRNADYRRRQRHQRFRTPGAKEFAVPLETPEQAARFNRGLVNACVRAQSQDTAVLPGQLHVAIIGAGATGTELAAELHCTARAIIAYGLEKVDPERDLRIVLIEAADRVPPALPERISASTKELLVKLGVEVRTSARVAEVLANGVKLSDGTIIPSELVVWSAGVQAPAFLANIAGLETNRINQLAVQPTLQTTLDDNIFAIGDCAACPRPGFPQNVPPRAQAAHQQSDFMVRQLGHFTGGPRVGGIPVPRLRFAGFAGKI
jgi:NADH dehydrogenase